MIGGDGGRPRITVHSLADVSVEELRRAGEGATGPGGCDLGVVGPPHLARLAEVLGVAAGPEADPDFTLLAGESQSRPWVVSCPAGLARGLASLDERELGGVSRRWAAVCAAPEPAGRDGLDGTLHRLWAFAREAEPPFALLIR